jgi:hypothetical protein
MLVGGYPSTVIAGLDPAIPIMWHGRASLSGMDTPGHDPTMKATRSAVILLPFGLD